MAPDFSLEVNRTKRALRDYMKINKDYVLPSDDVSFGAEDVDMLKYMKEQGFDLSLTSSAIRELRQEPEEQ